MHGDYQGCCAEARGHDHTNTLQLHGPPGHHSVSDVDGPWPAGRGRADHAGEASFVAADDSPAFMRTSHIHHKSQCLHTEQASGACRCVVVSLCNDLRQCLSVPLRTAHCGRLLAQWCRCPTDQLPLHHLCSIVPLRCSGAGSCRHLAFEHAVPLMQRYPQLWPAHQTSSGRNAEATLALLVLQACFVCAVDLQQPLGHAPGQRSSLRRCVHLPHHRHPAVLHPGPQPQAAGRRC